MPRPDFHSIAKTKSNPSQTISGALLNFNNKINNKSGEGSNKKGKPLCKIWRRLSQHAKAKVGRACTKPVSQDTHARAHRKTPQGVNHRSCLDRTMEWAIHSARKTAIAGQGTSASLSAHVTTLGHWREPLGPRGLGTHVERLAVFTHVPPRRG